MAKRPLGLKATKSAKKSRPLTDAPISGSNHQPPEKSYATVAFRTSSQTDSTSADDGDAVEDGLTIDDMFELKSRAQQHLVNFRLLSTPESINESGNLLRGICHECHRRMEIAGSEPVDNFTMSLLAWASLQLGLFLTPLGAAPRTELIQPGECTTLESWCSISNLALTSQDQPSPTTDDFKIVRPTLDLVQSLLDAESPTTGDKLQAWSTAVSEVLLECESPQGLKLWLITGALEIIESVSPNWDDHLVKSYGRQNLFDDFKALLEAMTTSLLKSDGSLVIIARYQITYHLAQRALLHGATLAESIEDHYFADDSEDNPTDEEAFPVDTNDPEYQNTLETLNIGQSRFWPFNHALARLALSCLLSLQIFGPVFQASTNILQTTDQICLGFALAIQHFSVALRLLETEAAFQEMSKEASKDLKIEVRHGHL